MPKGKVTKKPDLNSTAGKYYKARKTAKTKKEAAEIIGVTPQYISAIEQSKTYQEIVRYFKDDLLEIIDQKTIAQELKKNIVQDEDRGAKNQAIKIAIERIEPEAKQSNEDDRVIVILKQ